MHPDCEQCLYEQAQRLAKKHRIPVNDLKNIISNLSGYITDEGRDNIPVPEAARYLTKVIKDYTNANDLYAQEKKHYNDLMLNLQGDLRQNIRNSGQSFKTALRYALAGNIIDFGPIRSFDASKVISAAKYNIPAIDHSEILFEKLQKASTVLYLGDNAGEIVVDKLFIETIAHPNLYYAVRGGNILNDVTVEDAKYVGIDNVAYILSNGYDAPSTFLAKCSPEFTEIYTRAELVISKGQGNLEGLIYEKNKKIIFMLMVKCQVMAELVGVNVNDTVIWYNQIKKDEFKNRNYKR